MLIVTKGNPWIGSPWKEKADKEVKEGINWQGVFVGTGDTPKCKCGGLVKTIERKDKWGLGECQECGRPHLMQWVY